VIQSVAGVDSLLVTEMIRVTGCESTASVTSAEITGPFKFVENARRCTSRKQQPA
jgi:hypothetical protein